MRFRLADLLWAMVLVAIVGCMYHSFDRETAGFWLVVISIGLGLFMLWGDWLRINGRW